MKFDKQYLISVVKKNRDEHREIFEEALAGYKSKLLEELNGYIERINRGDVIYVSIHYPQPEDHTREYDRLLEMLAHTVEDSIELSETQFASYVQDDWNWKRQFLTSNSMYSDKARLDLGSL